MVLDFEQQVKKPRDSEYERNANQVYVHGVLQDLCQLPEGAPPRRIGATGQSKAIRKEPW